jgi:signal transduction histidine kinase
MYQGLAAVLEMSHGLSPVQREHLRTIISSGEDLLGLINNILDHSRLESGSVTLERIPFTLRDVVESGLDTVAAVGQKKGLELCLISPFRTDPPGLIGDPFRIKQVLLNLLSNAVKFTSQGSVTVQWTWEAVLEGKIKITLDVKDTGIGIPAHSEFSIPRCLTEILMKAEMSKLFRSFSQIDESITRSFGGSGM